MVRICLIKVVAISVAVFLLPASPQRAEAREQTVKEDYGMLEVKYLGGNNDALFFNVKYDNKTGNIFKLLVLDEVTGEALFQDSYSIRGSFEKQFKIPRLTDTDYVTFLIRSAKENIQLSYKVKVTTKVVDETVFLKNRELVSYK